MFNHRLAKQAALRGINRYLQGHIVQGDRDGLWHGETGRRRARKARAYLRSINDNNAPAILIVLMAIFGEPNAGFFGWVPGRSSRLAGLIANEMISGGREYGDGANYNTLRSSIFSREAIRQVAHNFDNHRVVVGEMGGGFGYFDHTKGLRDLLQQVLNHFFGAEERTSLQQSIRRLKKELENPREQIDLTILPRPILDNPIIQKSSRMCAAGG